MIREWFVVTGWSGEEWGGDGEGRKGCGPKSPLGAKNDAAPANIRRRLRC